MLSGHLCLRKCPEVDTVSFLSSRSVLSVPTTTPALVSHLALARPHQAAGVQPAPAGLIYTAHVPLSTRCVPASQLTLPGPAVGDKSLNDCSGVPLMVSLFEVITSC